MTPESLRALDKEQLIALVLAQAAQIANLVARVASLEARLGAPPKTPDNSSLPPSKGQKANCPERAKKKRKGRPGVTRKLAETPDHVRDVHAETCRRCKCRPEPAGQPKIHAYDFIDLPPIKPIVLEARLREATSMGPSRLVAEATSMGPSRLVAEATSMGPAARGADRCNVQNLSTRSRTPARPATGAQSRDRGRRQVQRGHDTLERQPVRVRHAP